MGTVKDSVVDLLAAAVAKVPTQAQFGLDAIRPPLSPSQRQQVLTRRVTLHKAVRRLVEADDVETAYALVATLIDAEHPDGRIFLDDLAEMLALPPLVYRALRSSNVDDGRRNAA